MDALHESSALVSLSANNPPRIARFLTILNDNQRRLHSFKLNLEKWVRLADGSQRPQHGRTHRNSQMTNFVNTICNWVMQINSMSFVAFKWKRLARIPFNSTQLNSIQKWDCECLFICPPSHEAPPFCYFKKKERKGGGKGIGGSRGGLGGWFTYHYKRKKYSPRRRQHFFSTLPTPIFNAMKKWRVVLHKNIFDDDDEKKKINKFNERRNEWVNEWMKEWMNGTFSGCSTGVHFQRGLLYITL